MKNKGGPTRIITRPKRPTMHQHCLRCINNRLHSPSTCHRCPKVLEMTAETHTSRWPGKWRLTKTTTTKAKMTNEQ